jgi:hypothetical protein
MEKIDWNAHYKALYSPSASKAQIIDVPVMNFLMIDGQGDPNTSPLYQQALEVLYNLAYTLKFNLKKAGIADYRVMPLEGLWWASDMNVFSVEDKSAWQWTMMIAQPEVVTPDHVAAAFDAARQKKSLALLDQVRFEAYKEGLCAQVLHLGPYSAEGPTVARLHAFIAENSYQLCGKHHEIYIGDPRRSAPEKLRTILRQPIEPA